MIKTAEQIMLEIGDSETTGRRPYPAKRRSRLLPPEPCKNAYRGCKGSTGDKYAANGHCRNCTHRQQRHGDSWYHHPNVHHCRRPDCFMKGTEGHP